MVFELLNKRLAVCLLTEPALPDSEFVSLTVSGGEISLVCEEEKVPKGCKMEPGWRALKIKGPLDFSLVGILADIAAVLAQAKVSIFAVSTFETDYVLVKEDSLKRALQALEAEGHSIGR
jgi:hypothetical protein